MRAETIGMISGGLVICSVIPYALRTYQGKIKPNVTSWGLWTLIGAALLLTYKSSGAADNIWPAVFGFTNPFLVTCIALWRNGKRETLTKVDWVCLTVSLISLLLWCLTRDEKGLAQFALYLAILADGAAAVPTIVYAWSQPREERPIPWVMFSIGYGVAIFAITDHTFANYILPLYMSLGTFVISVPLIRYQLRQKIPLRQWI